jgi:hypothetical protein
VQIAIYKRGAHGKYKLYATVWTKNYNYRLITQYRVSIKLGSGTFRLYAVAPADTWHLKTTTRGYKQIVIK